MDPLTWVAIGLSSGLLGVVAGMSVDDKFVTDSNVRLEGQRFMERWSLDKDKIADDIAAFFTQRRENIPRHDQKVLRMCMSMPKDDADMPRLARNMNREYATRSKIKQRRPVTAPPPPAPAAEEKPDEDNEILSSQWVDEELNCMYTADEARNPGDLPLDVWMDEKETNQRPPATCDAETARSSSFASSKPKVEAPEQKEEKEESESEEEKDQLSEQTEQTEQTEQNETQAQEGEAQEGEAQGEAQTQKSEETKEQKEQQEESLSVADDESSSTNSASPTAPLAPPSEPPSETAASVREEEAASAAPSTALSGGGRDEEGPAWLRKANRSKGKNAEIIPDDASDYSSLSHELTALKDLDTDLTLYDGDFVKDRMAHEKLPSQLQWKTVNLEDDDDSSSVDSDWSAA